MGLHVHHVEGQMVESSLLWALQREFRLPLPLGLSTLLCMKIPVGWVDSAVCVWWGKNSFGFRGLTRRRLLS